MRKEELCAKLSSQRLLSYAMLT